MEPLNSQHPGWTDNVFQQKIQIKEEALPGLAKKDSSDDPCDDAVTRGGITDQREPEGLDVYVRISHTSARVSASFQTRENIWNAGLVVLLFSTRWNRNNDELFKFLLHQRKLVEIIILISFLNSNTF